MRFAVSLAPTMRAFSAVCLVGLTLTGCATAPKEFRMDAAAVPQQEQMLWPQPPEVPRFRYLGQLLGEQNFKPKAEESSGIRSALRWLAGLLAGDQAPVELQRPQAGVVDAAGRIYVTDPGRGAVFVFDVVAGELLVWDKADGLANFANPVGIALGPGGDILVADAQLGYVVRLDSKGEARGRIGKGLLRRPTGLAYDPRGKRIYVADTYAHDIKVFDDDGRLVATIGHRGEGPGEFNFPTFLAFANGKLYVTDAMNSRIEVFGDEGEVLKLKFGSRGLYLGDLVRPKGVAVDGEGNIYVVESYYDRLLVFNPDGKLLLALGGTGLEPGQFYLPAAVWVDRKNRVFVADMFNARVTMFQFLGG